MRLSPWILVFGLACLAPVAAWTQEPAPTESVQVDSAPPPEPVTDQRATQDEEIRNALQAVFDRVPGLTQVDVIVDAGVVRLVGSVLNGDTRTRAVELAASMDGVVFVDDRIVESTSLEEQLRPTWSRLRSAGYGLVAMLPLLAVALLMVVGAAGLGALLARWGGPAFLSTRNPFLQGLIRRSVQAAVVLAGIILALDLLDATALVGALVGTAGLAGLAVGFAFKDIVENYLAGTLLAFRQPFAKNDHVRVESFEGKVVRLTPRETILMSLEGNHIRLPNALIFRSPMVNFTRNPLRRFEFEVGLGTSDDLARARRVAVEVLATMDGVLNDPPPQALIAGFGDSTIAMKVLAWVDQRDADWLRARSEAIRVVKTALEEAGISLPSPELLVRMQRTAAEEPEAARAAAPPASGEASVAVDRSLDAQIEEDRQASDEGDLLDTR